MRKRLPIKRCRTKSKLFSAPEFHLPCRTPSGMQSYILLRNCKNIRPKYLLRLAFCGSIDQDVGKYLHTPYTALNMHFCVARTWRGPFLDMLFPHMKLSPRIAEYYSTFEGTNQALVVALGTARRYFVQRQQAGTLAAAATNLSVLMKARVPARTSSLTPKWPRIMPKLEVCMAWLLGCGTPAWQWRVSADAHKFLSTSFFHSAFRDYPGGLPTEREEMQSQKGSWNRMSSVSLT